MDASSGLPWLVAQTFSTGGGPGSGAGTPSAPDPALELALLAMRRWVASMTLSPPVSAPGLISPGLWAWLAALGALFVMASAAGGPGRAVAQLLDVAGHARLLSDALARLRRSGRLVAVVVGMTVVTMTATQAWTYGRPEGRDEVLLLTRGHSLAEVALGQGVLAALTPLRDVALLAMMVPLLALAAVVLFRFANDRWGTAIRPPKEVRARSSRWATIGWLGLGLYGVYYRTVGFFVVRGGMPTGGCLAVEVVLVPALMALATGVVLAWVLVELRGVGMDGSTGETVDALGAVLLVPATVVAGLLAFPGSFVATATVLVGPYAPPGSLVGSALAPFLRWILGWGLVEVQASGLLWVGMFGAIAWGPGTASDAARGYLRLLSAEGGRVVAAVAAAGVAAGIGSALAYGVVLALPASTWLLGAADGYAHYASLPVGLVLLSALVELGERALPMAGLAGVKPEAEAL